MSLSLSSSSHIVAFAASIMFHIMTSKVYSKPCVWRAMNPILGQEQCCVLRATEARLCPVYEVHDTHKIRSSAREFVWIAGAGKRPTWRLHKGNFSLSSKAVSHFRWYKMCAPFYLGNLIEWAEQKAHGGVTHHWQNWSERWGGTYIFFKLLFFCPKMILIFVRGNAYKVQLYRLWYTCCYPPTLLTVTDIRHTYI